MTEQKQMINVNDFRDEKIIGLTLLGYSKTRIAKEMGLSRNTVLMVINCPWGQERLNEELQSIDHAMQRLPEVTGLALDTLKRLIDPLERRYLSLEERKFNLEVVKISLNIAIKFRELQGNLVNSVN